MDESMYTDPELQIVTERCRKYQGTAKVNINQITPHPSISQNLNTKNVERLCEIFDKEGCRRLDVYNHVSAVVSRQHFHEALRAARLSATDLITDQPNRYPHLNFSTGPVKCLHGQHPLKAGEDYLPSIDQWWTVDLYLDGKPEIPRYPLPRKACFDSPQILVPTFKSALLMNIPMRESQAMVKFTEKFDNIDMKLMHTSRIDGWRGCRTTKPEGFADLNLIQVSELLLIRCSFCPRWWYMECKLDLFRRPWLFVATR